MSSVYLNSILAEAPAPTEWSQKRTLYAKGFSSYPAGRGSERLEVLDMGVILIGDEQIDVRGLHDIVSKRQLDAIGYMLRYLMVRNTDAVIDLDARLEELYAEIAEKGPDTVYSPFFTTTERFLDLPRRCELRAVVGRMRGITYKSELCVPGESEKVGG